MTSKRRSLENSKRSFVKSMTFRFIIIISDTILGYAITRRVDYTAGFVIFTNIASTIIYYGHGRIWSRIHWGRSKT